MDISEDITRDVARAIGYAYLQKSNTVYMEGVPESIMSEVRPMAQAAIKAYRSSDEYIHTIGELQIKLGIATEKLEHIKALASMLADTKDIKALREGYRNIAGNANEALKEMNDG